MGKNLKGKEYGKGICQRKDGQLYARFVNKRGKRQDNYFATLPEARNRLEDARYADKHGNIVASSDMTLDAWFEYWIDLGCDTNKAIGVQDLQRQHKVIVPFL